MPIPPHRPRLAVDAAAAAVLSCMVAPTTATAADGLAPASDCALPGRTGWTDEGHDTDRALFQPATGTRRVLTLFVDFPDTPATESTQPYADHLAPVADWFGTAGYGRIRLDVTPLHRWMRLPAPSDSYGFARGLTFEAHEKYLQDAITAADPYADLSRYDMVYVVPTKAATVISFSPAYIHDPATPGVTADGTRLKWAVTFGQDMWHWGFKVAVHETGHTFGLPDLYAFSGATHRYVGGWDVMGDIAGHAPQFLGWHSWKLGWTRDRQVACLAGTGRRTVALTPVERPGGTKIAVVRTGETTGYVAEARQGQGILVYRVDSAVQTGEGPVRVMNDQRAYAPGEAFTDPDAGVRIDVLPGSAVRVTRTR
ncbi:peptidase M6 [Streptomyces sp. NPDC088762]|uniref:peptidase M6 n=1 Tax=Streptomyces sp. NPDC088762 TaxID=3365891 RepID=UPI0037F6CF81